MCALQVPQTLDTPQHSKTVWRACEKKETADKCSEVEKGQACVGGVCVALPGQEQFKASLERKKWWLHPTLHLPSPAPLLTTVKKGPLFPRANLDTQAQRPFPTTSSMEHSPPSRVFTCPCSTGPFPVGCAHGSYWGRERERRKERKTSLKDFSSPNSVLSFTPHPWPTFLTEIIFTYCFHCLSSDDVSAHSSLASPPPAPTPPRWERLLPKLSTTSLLRQQQACALGSSFSLASWLWGPAPRLSSCLWASSLSTTMAGSPSQVQLWTWVLFCLPPVMMNISPLCHRHWPPKLNSASHLPAQPCPARRAAHLILWPRQDTIVYKLPGPESHGRGLSPTSVSPSTSDHCPDLPLASQITHISSPSIHPQYHDSCLNSWISSPH